MKIQKRKFYYAKNCMSKRVKCSVSLLKDETVGKRRFLVIKTMQLIIDLMAEWCNWCGVEIIKSFVVNSLFSYHKHSTLFAINIKAHESYCQ